jgi:hypothetical protein
MIKRAISRAWRKYRGWPFWRVQIPLGTILFLLILGLAVPSSPDDSHAGSTAHADTHEQGEPPSDAVEGSMETAGASGELADSIDVDQVWCQWSGGHVFLHVRFHNTSVEDLSVEYNTRYQIENGGTHGDSFENEQTTNVDGGLYRVLTVDAGAPDGVSAGAAIGDCEPEMKSVDTQ